MKTKSFKNYLDKRLSSDEIKEIEQQAFAEAKLLKSMQEEIAKAVSTYMKTKNIGFNEFARQSNMSPSQLAKVQRGESNLTLASIAHLFTMLEKTPHFIIDKK